MDYSEVASVLSQVAGRDIAYQAVSPEVFDQALAGQGWPEDARRMMESLFDMVRAGWTAPTTPELQTLLEREPTRLEDYARDYASFFKAE
jgi:hypothetical protein